MHFQRELEENLPRGTVGSASSEVLKGRGSVSVAYSGGQPQVFQLFLTLPGFVQMFRPGCYGAFPSSLLSFWCCCSVSAGLVWPSSGFPVIKNCFFRKTHIWLLFVFFHFLLSLNTSHPFQQVSKKQLIVWKSNSGYAKPEASWCNQQCPLSLQEISKSLLTEPKASCGGSVKLPLCDGSVPPGLWFPLAQAAEVALRCSSGASVPREFYPLVTASSESRSDTGKPGHAFSQRCEAVKRDAPGWDL